MPASLSHRYQLNSNYCWKNPFGLFLTLAMSLSAVCILTTEIHACPRKETVTQQEPAERAAKPEQTTEPVQGTDVDLPPNARPVQNSDPGDSSKKDYEFTKRTGVIYAKGRDYRLACDIYSPVGKGPFPIVLAVHGGAWRHGSKIQMVRHAWKMASAGYVVVAINYRKAPDHKFPAQIHDCKNAVRWIRSHADELRIDPDRMAVFGYSAGAHLAALLGTSDAKDGLEGDPANRDLKEISTRVQCVVAGGAPCEFDWVQSNALVYWLGDSPADNPEIYRVAAPTNYISKDDPPFIFFHGDADKVVPSESSLKMYRQLSAMGVVCRYEAVAGKGHFATFSDLSWMDTAIEFMDQILAVKK